MKKHRKQKSVFDHTKPEADKLQRRNIGVTDFEWADWKKRAARKLWSLNTWIRQACRQFAGKEKP